MSSVTLLLAGVAGGVYLGNDRETRQQGIEQLTVSQTAELDFLKARHNEHSAARAAQREAEADAAAKAAREAKAAARRARKIEAAAIRKAEQKRESERALEDEGAEPDAFTGPIPDSCNEYSGNRKIGCALMLDRGFELDQFPCLDKLWKKESGWNHKARNRSSGAYGIPQALPGPKMASAGRDWRSNPATQIKWGLGYIKGRYGTPCKAWAHSQSRGWY